MKPKTLAEAIKNEKLKVLSDRKRAQLEWKLHGLLDQVEDLRIQLESDRTNRLRIQWLSRGWMAKD